MILDENGLVEYEELVKQQELRPVKHKDAKELELRLFAEADKDKDNKLDADEFEKFQVGYSRLLQITHYRFNDPQSHQNNINFSFRGISKKQNRTG